MPPPGAPLHAPSLVVALVREKHIPVETPAAPFHLPARSFQSGPSLDASVDRMASRPDRLAPPQALSHSPGAACKSVQIRAGSFHIPPRDELPAHAQNHQSPGLVLRSRAL